MQEYIDLNKEIGVLKKSGLLVVVEGKKDRSALNSFGIINVVILDKPLFEIVELVCSKAKVCVVLTDLDREGKALYSKISKDLKKHGVKVNDRFRNFLFKNTAIRQIEGLSSYVDGLI